MDKDKAQKEVEHIFEGYSGFTLQFEEWAGTGEDDLLVTITNHAGHISHIYLTGEEDRVFLYVGDDVIEPLTEATVLRVMFFQAAQEVERLRAASGQTYCAYCGAEFPIDAPDSAEVERLRGALTRINILADPYRESGAWASPEAYSRWAAQIASDALNG